MTASHSVSRLEEFSAVCKCRCPCPPHVIVPNFRACGIESIERCRIIFVDGELWMAICTLRFAVMYEILPFAAKTAGSGGLRGGRVVLPCAIVR